MKRSMLALFTFALLTGTITNAQSEADTVREVEHQRLRAQTISVHGDQDSVLIKQLTDLEFELNDLLAERNFDTYASYLADDYVRISANGNIETKEQVLRKFQTSQTVKAVPEILQIRIYGNTAIMNIHLALTLEDQGKSVVRESLLTKVFILRNGRWYMVSNQGTAIGKK